MDDDKAQSMALTTMAFIGSKTSQTLPIDDTLISKTMGYVVPPEVTKAKGATKVGRRKISKKSPCLVVQHDLSLLV